MAKRKDECVFARDTAEKFSGMDRRGTTGTAEVAGDICNFRVLADGSLEKREGYGLLSSLPAAIRGVWAGHVGESEVLLAAAGDRVYLVSRDGVTSEPAQELVVLDSTEGIANFFCVQGCVYMLDGVGIYCYDGQSMYEAEGYAPLYGTDWHPLTGGEVYEPLNAFSRHVRLRYVMAVSSSTLSLQLPFASVEAVYHNNRPMAAEDVTLSEDGLSVQLGYTISANLSVTVYGTLADSVDTGATVRSCGQAVTMGGEFDDRVFLYHGNEAADIYVSRKVEPEQLAAARKVWSGLSSLYFPQEDKLTAGDGKWAVTGLCRHYDRLLVFRGDGTCMANLAQGADGSIYPAMPVNSSVGCASPEAMCLYGNDPITVNARGIYRWLQTTDERDECNAIRVSDKVADLLPPSRCARLHAAAWYDRGEVWFFDPEDEQGEVLILCPTSTTWYRFAGIRMQGCVSYDHAMCFWFGAHLYRFSTAYQWDAPYGAQCEIAAHWTATGLHLGKPQDVKRMGECAVRHSGEGALSISVRTDRGVTRSVQVYADGRAAAQLTRCRLSAGRFVHTDCCMRASGAGQVRVYGLSLCAGK